MNINKDSLWLNPSQISIIEDHYKSKYICDSSYPIIDKVTGQITGYTPYSVSYFFNPSPDTTKGHTNFFIVYKSSDTLMISDGSNILDLEFHAIGDDSEIIFSRTRHDYRSLEDGSSIDGGRDYCKINSTKDQITVYLLKVNATNGELEIVDQVLTNNPNQEIKIIPLESEDLTKYN